VVSLYSSFITIAFFAKLLQGGWCINAIGDQNMYNMANLVNLENRPLVRSGPGFQIPQKHNCLLKFPKETAKTAYMLGFQVYTGSESDNEK